jgi:hypothetical protein
VDVDPSGPMSRNPGGGWSAVRSHHVDKWQLTPINNLVKDVSARTVSLIARTNQEVCTVRSYASFHDLFLRDARGSERVTLS